MSTTTTSTLSATERRRALHTAWAMLGDPHAAEDVVQDLELRLARSAGPTDERGAYVARATVNAALDALRAGRRRATRESRRALERGEVDERTPTSECERQEDLEVVRATLMELEADLRLPLVLRFFHGCKLREIAETLECSLSTAQARVERGLGVLRTRLEHLGYAGLAPLSAELLGEIPTRLAIPVVGTSVAAKGLFGSLKAKLATLALGSAAAVGFATTWDEEPFADAIAIEIKLSDEREVRIDDPKEVEALMAKLEVTSIQNDISMGLIPPARLVFHQKDGTTRSVSVAGDSEWLHGGGIVKIHPRFTKAVNAYLSAHFGEPVDMTVFKLPERPKPKPWTVEDLDAPFTSLEVEYGLGGNAHRLQVTDPDLVAELRALFRVEQRIEKDQYPFAPLDHYGFRTGVDLHLADGRELGTMYFGEHQLSHHSLGLLHVAPAFFERLERHVAEREGCPVDLFVENPLPEARVKQAALRMGILGAAELTRVEIDPGAGGKVLVIEDAATLKALRDTLRRAFAPREEPTLPVTGRVVRLHFEDGTTHTVHELEREASPLRPFLCDVVRIEGVGCLWISDDWFDELEQLLRGRSSDEAAAKRLEQTLDVLQDVPAFFERRLSLTAHWRTPEHGYMHTFSRDETRALCNGWGKASFEPIAKDTPWWQTALEGARGRRAGSIELSPGLGFTLSLIPIDAHTALVPGAGKLVFEGAPFAALVKRLAAFDGVTQEEIEMVPR